MSSSGAGSEVDEYIERLLLGEDPVLEAALRESEAACRRSR